MIDFKKPPAKLAPAPGRGRVEARRFFERSLAIDEKALAPGHPQLVQARATLAEHCREARGLRDAESRKLCRRHGL